jgi:membrane fusion protein (multidrug efflux system)
MRYVIIIVGVISVIAVLAGLKAAQISTLIGFGEKMQAMGPPPEVVSTVKAEQQTWEATLEAIGTVTSARGVEVSNDAAGVVSAIRFDSGQVVKKGQVLVELDTKVERAQLASIRARQKLAQTSLTRSQALVPAGALAQSQLDADEANFDELVAEGKALAAQIDRKIVRAPFSGKLGIRNVDLGQYLAPGTAVTVLESSDSVFVDFTLPQRDLSSLANGMVVRTIREGSSEKLAEGVITAISPAIDAATRTIKVRASLVDPENKVRSGMFVGVQVVLPQNVAVTAIPVTAFVQAAYGESVFIVAPTTGPNGAPANGPDGKPAFVARQQFVRLGEMRGDFASIAEGVKPGQEVVTAGAFKLRNNAPIAIKNDGAVKPKLAPTPENK